MTIKTSELWLKLEEKGIIQADDAKHIAVISPWYIKVLLAISGWLGALFLLCFVFIALFWFIESLVASLFVSVVLIFIAYRILLRPNNEFYEHLGLAISISGQVLFIRVISDWESSLMISLTLAIFQGLLTYFMPSFLHRFFSTIFTAGALAASLAILGAPQLMASGLIFVTAWLCLNEFSFAKQYQRVSAVMYGLVVSTLLLNCNALFGTDVDSSLHRLSETAMQMPGWVSVAIYIIALVFTVWQLLVANRVGLNTGFSKLVLLFALLLGLVTLNAPGIGVCLVILLVGFAHSNRVLVGLAISSLVVYSSTYYFMMEETLLYKSGLLLVVAALMLLGRFLLNSTLLQLKDK